jgi:hypothetical protein
LYILIIAASEDFGELGDRDDELMKLVPARRLNWVRVKALKQNV